MAITYFGLNQDGDGFGSAGANYLLVNKFTNTAGNGTLKEIGVNMYPADTLNVRVGIYSDNAGAPGSLLLDAGVIALTSAGFSSKTGLSLEVTNGTVYWLAMVFDSYPEPCLLANVGANVAAYRSWTYGALPSSYGTPDGYETFQWCMRGGVDSTVANPIVKIINE